VNRIGRPIDTQSPLRSFHDLLKARQRLVEEEARRERFIGSHDRAEDPAKA
jgi:hypothetical protein